ncbi:MAG: hypothetical protein AAFQ19_00295 [Pseudomonadota bacterium]
MADSKTGVYVSSISLGATVIALYALFVLLVTIGFGSYIYRTAWQAQPISASSDGDRQALVADIDNLLFIIKREQDLGRAKSSVTQDIQFESNVLSEIEARHKQSFASISRAKIAVRSQVDTTIGRLSEYQFALDGPQRFNFDGALAQMHIAVKDEPANLRAAMAEQQLRGLLGTLAVGLEKSQVDLDTLDSFKILREDAENTLDTLAAAVTAANSASHVVLAELEAKQKEIDELVKLRGAHDSNIQALHQTLSPGDPARARLSALTLNLPIFPDILMRFVSFPTIFLTLIVTIAAGGLGTVVAFSRRYYSSHMSGELTLSRLFVNVGEGIAAAIAIFLFSGAGMLALTQGGGSGNEVELSPYTVAFVAFLSGFMAEDAFASIQAAGKRIFSTDAQAAKPEDPEP